MSNYSSHIRGVIIPQALLAGVLIGFFSIIGVLFVPGNVGPDADMRIEPSLGAYAIGETFSITVRVESKVPTNVFTGEVLFDPTVLTVKSIDYNTSIADLWAERPWYENGDGTVSFAGGTTNKGGFSGTGSLITITFTPLRVGDARVRIQDARILAHDGLGTDVALLNPIDALFSVSPEMIDAKTIATPEGPDTSIAIVEAASTDVNGDGKQTILDMSIFMGNLFEEDPRFDFNADGTVDTKDLSIIMSKSQ